MNALGEFLETQFMQRRINWNPCFTERLWHTFPSIHCVFSIASKIIICPPYVHLMHTYSYPRAKFTLLRIDAITDKDINFCHENINTSLMRVNFGVRVTILSVN